MAEFKEVMRQRERMCDYYHECNINGCPLDEFASCVDPFACNAERYEAEVMKWAAAHPEPQYPSWQEWQNENFPGSRFPLSMCHFMNHACPEAESCTTCREQPIPADIAEKLGIKPKESKNERGQKYHNSG